MAEVDLFLRLDGIAGESTDDVHRGEIDVVAFSWAEHLPLAGPGGGTATGRVQMGELQVIAPTSSASPPLMLACASGRHVRSATLSARRPGEGRRDHLVIKLDDVIVTGYRVLANESGDDTVPTDQVSLSFGRIEYVYTPEQPDGSAGTPVTAAWDDRRVVKKAATRAAVPKKRTPSGAAARVPAAAKKATKKATGRAR